MGVEFWWKARWLGWSLVIISIILMWMAPRLVVSIVNGLGIFFVAFGHYKEKEYEKRLLEKLT